MPLQIFSRNLWRFFDGFLNAIFTEMERPGINRLLYDSRREGLGNGDKCNLFGTTPNAFRCSLDAFANLREICLYLFPHLRSILTSSLPLVTKSLSTPQIPIEENQFQVIKCIAVCDTPYENNKSCTAHSHQRHDRMLHPAEQNARAFRYNPKLAIWRWSHSKW